MIHWHCIFILEMLNCLWFCSLASKNKKHKTKLSALAGVAQWTVCRPANQRVAGSIPSQGTCLGCGLGPWRGSRKRQPHIDVSLPLFLSPPLSLKLKKKFLIKKYISLIHTSVHISKSEHFHIATMPFSHLPKLSTVYSLLITR